jgi:hypothetical protein
VRPLRQTAYVARTGGVSSPSVVVFVATRVLLDSPSPGAVSSPVTFAGSLSPAHAGVAVGLATLLGGRFVVLTQARTDASGRFSITRMLSRGSATYVVFTSAHSGNRPGSRSMRLDVG